LKEHCTHHPKTSINKYKVHVTTLQFRVGLQITCVSKSKHTAEPPEGTLCRKELVILQLMFSNQAGLTQRESQTGIDPQQLVVPVSTCTQIHVVSRNMKIGMLAIDRSIVATLTLARTQCSTYIHVRTNVRTQCLHGLLDIPRTMQDV
jgi:hypothetical protein